MIPMEMGDVTDATDFRNEDMQALERALRCGVCKDFFDSPVLVPQCGHSFCSMCMRDYLATTAECPSCRSMTSASSLLKNSMLEDVIFAYRAARSFLLTTLADIEGLRELNFQLVRDAKRHDQQLAQQTQRRASRSSEDEGPCRSRPAKRSRHFHRPFLATPPTKSQRRRPVIIQDDMEVDEAGGRGANGGNISDIEVIEQPKLGAASSSSFPKESRWNSGSRDEAGKSPTKKHVAMAMKRMVDLDIADLDESEGVHSSGSAKKQEGLDPIVECPLCNFRLRHSEVDPHIENGCAQITRASGSKAWSTIFAGANGGAGQAGSGTKGVTAKDKGKKKATVIEEDDPKRRVLIPKVTWSVTKDKTLRELLESFGLSTDGDRKKQERRYDKWIALHNASLDTARVRKTLSQLRKELRAWEKTTEADQAARSDRKRKEKGGDELDEKEYLEANKVEIAKLVAKARASAKFKATRPPSEARQQLPTGVEVNGAA